MHGSSRSPLVPKVLAVVLVVVLALQAAMVASTWPVTARTSNSAPQTRSFLNSQLDLNHNGRPTKRAGKVGKGRGAATLS